MTQRTEVNLCDHRLSRSTFVASAGERFPILCNCGSSCSLLTDSFRDRFSDIIRSYIVYLTGIMGRHRISVDLVFQFPCDVTYLVISVSIMEEKIKVGKYEINYVKFGNGPHNVFCAPGALGTIWSEFKPQVEGLLRDKFSVVVWDPPGYGKSYPPEKEFNVDYFERDADLAHALMKTLNMPKFSLLGFSDGGITSLILAAKYPQAVTKLVVWGANAFILPNELETYKKMRDVNNWSQRKRESMVEIYGAERFASYLAAWVDTMEKIYETNNGNICSEHIKNIICPTFILYGEKDPMVDQVHVSHLHTHISGSRIHLYPEGKHSIHLSYADDFNKRVQEFLLMS